MRCHASSLGQLFLKKFLTFADWWLQFWWPSNSQSQCWSFEWQQWPANLSRNCCGSEFSCMGRHNVENFQCGSWDCKMLASKLHMCHFAVQHCKKPKELDFKTESIAKPFFQNVVQSLRTQEFKECALKTIRVIGGINPRFFCASDETQLLLSRNNMASKLWPLPSQMISQVNWLCKLNTLAITWSLSVCQLPAGNVSCVAWPVLSWMFGWSISPETAQADECHFNTEQPDC